MGHAINNWLVNTIHDAEIKRCAGVYLKGRLIDIGCADKPFRKILEGKVSEHLGLDHARTIHDKSRIDLLGTAYQIPSEAEAFDSALCTAVLEHLEEPLEALKETARVLKRGGHAVYTVPLFWHIHEAPRDFYRFTEYGLRYLFEGAGFEIVELKPLSGFCVTFGQELIYYLERFRKGGWINPLWWIIPAVGTLIQALAYLFNRIDSSRGFTWMYLVVAKKR